MMSIIINAKTLRASLPEVVGRVRRGERFTVVYRSRPAFRIIPVDDLEPATGVVEDDPLYRAAAVGRSSDGGAASDHDATLYRR